MDSKTQERRCNECGKPIDIYKFNCNECLAVLSRHDRWEERADRDEIRDERDGRRFC